MKARFFFVIYLQGEMTKLILDGMRIIADPRQKNFSHITVKGPYQTIQRKILFKDSERIQGKEIKVLGAGNFFSEDQNTVFLRCEDKQELYEIWKAKDERTYKNFHPHITIYDGGDKKFAIELYNTINAHHINFSFIVKKLELYSSHDKHKLFNFQSQVEYDILSKIVGMHLNQDNISTLDSEQRIVAIDKLCNYLERQESVHEFHNYKKNYLKKYRSYKQIRNKSFFKIGKSPL